MGVMVTDIKSTLEAGVRLRTMTGLFSLAKRMTALAESQTRAQYQS